MPVEPDNEQFQEMQTLAGSAEDGPMVMLNLNRTATATPTLATERSPLRVLERVGGRILWHAPVQATVVGVEADRYDDVIAVWYPSGEAFVALATDPEVMAARADRIAGLERAALLRCDAAPEPVLTTP